MKNRNPSPRTISTIISIVLVEP